MFNLVSIMTENDITIFSSKDDDTVRVQTIDPTVFSYSQFVNEAQTTEFAFPRLDDELDDELDDDQIIDKYDTTSEPSSPQTEHSSFVQHYFQLIMLGPGDISSDHAGEIEGFENVSIPSSPEAKTTAKIVDTKSTNQIEMEHKPTRLEKNVRKTSRVILPQVSEAVALPAKQSRLPTRRKRKSPKRKTAVVKVTKKRPKKQSFLKSKSIETDEANQKAPSSKSTRQSLFRSRFGCWICRLKHKKCDETTPSCINCSKQHILCDYSVERPKYMFRGKDRDQKLDDIRRIWLSRYKMERLLSGEDVPVKYFKGNKSYDSDAQKVIRQSS